MSGIGSTSHMKLNGGLVAHQDFGWAIVADDSETITLPKKIVALTADHLAPRLAWLGFKSRPLAFDPAELADYCKPYCIVAHLHWDSNAHPATRWVNPQVQVLDGLVNHLHTQAIHSDPMLFSIHSDSSPIPEFGR